MYSAWIPEEAASNQILKEQLSEIIATLTDREQKIIRLRFGIGGGRPHTLEEVGNEFEVTRERIRQIEAKALSKVSELSVEPSSTKRISRLE